MRAVLDVELLLTAVASMAILAVRMQSCWEHTTLALSFFLYIHLVLIAEFFV